MGDEIDPRLIFPAVFIIALIFWATMYVLINKVLDIIERKRKDR